MTSSTSARHSRFWVQTTELLLQRSRRLLWLGSFAALFVGGAALRRAAGDMPWSAALIALPLAWTGVFAAAAIAGSPGVRHRGAVAAATLSCSLTVLLVVGKVL